MIRRFTTAAAVALAATAAAHAQRGPSFDCAKVSNAVERAICEDPMLSAGDREMAAAYRALITKLSGAAKAHLVSDQARWIHERDRDCATTVDDVGRCLETRYVRRTRNLREFGEGAYPFVGTRSIYVAGRAGASDTYTIDIRYPQFESTSVDYSAVNRRLSDEAHNVADAATPKPEGAPSGSYEQGFALYRPSPNAIALAIDHIGTGGAHGNSGVDCALIDLRTGKTVGPEGVFAPGDAWLTRMVQIVRAELAGEVDDDALEPASLARQLRDPRHYCYRPDRLTLIFNRYALAAPLAGGREFSIELPYARVQSLWRSDGPLGRR